MLLISGFGFRIYALSLIRLFQLRQHIKVFQRRHVPLHFAAASDFLEQSPPNGIPPWDYDAPATGAFSRSQTDSSAAAIAACALFMLSRILGEIPRAVPYRNTALAIVNTLTRPPYIHNDPEWEGILKGGCYHMHKDLGINESSMWGDFYFVEAMNMALSAIARSHPAPIAAATVASH